MQPIRSDAILKAAKGKPCTLRFPGICNHDPATTVAAHVRDRFKGGAIKASDHSSVHACYACHSYLDEGHGTAHRMSDADLYLAIIGALQETWLTLIHDGIIQVPQNKPKARTVKPRKPKEKRQAIPRRPNPWPPKGSRKIQNGK